MSKLRLAFMGTPDFAVHALKALVSAGHEIVIVYTQPPKPAGRGHLIQKSAVHQVAEGLGLTVRTPKTLRTAEEQDFFASLNLDIAIVAAYGLLLPLPILRAPRWGGLNIHASLLPRWRGAAPIQRAMLAGDQETGITIMQMAEGLDTGDMLRSGRVSITASTTAGSLHDELALMGAHLIVETLDLLAGGCIKAVPQSEKDVTYAAKLSREDGLINWKSKASDIERQIRSLQPWPGCSFVLGAETIKVMAATVHDEEQGKPGVLLDERFTVTCGQGSLTLDVVQRSGKKPTDGASLLRGLRLPLGQEL